MAKTGRPSTYTPKIAAAICERLAAGESVKTICTAPELPEAATVFRWLSVNPEFRDQYMRARESRADARFEKVDEIMQELRAGEIDSNQARVMLDAVKWQTGKESPKRYGDRLELAGDRENPIQTRVVIEVVDSAQKVIE